MSRRGIIGLVVLGGWAAGMGLLATRVLNPSMADQLAEVSLRIVPITTYYAVERDGKHIGFASIAIDTVPRTLQVTEYMVTDGARGGRVTDQVTVSYSRGLSLRDFAYLRGDGADTARVSGTVIDSTLVVNRASTVDSMRLDAPPFPGALARTVALFLSEPRVGVATPVATVDPRTGSAGSTTFRIDAESLFVVVDSAVADSSGRWFAVHRDTVRAWRLVASDSTPPAWIDAQGLVVQADRADGLTLRRTAFELAFENWRQADPSRSVSARANGNVMPSSWLAAGVSRPVVARDSMRVRLGGGDPPRVIGQWFGGRARSGSTRSVTRSDSIAMHARYTLPAADTWRNQFVRSLRSEPLLDVDDPAIARLALRLRGTEPDPAVVVRRIAAWVHDSITAAAGEPARTARDVMASRRGDAREFAMLQAALTRAAGIPARLVSGLLYHDGRFYAHAWTIVFLNRWVPVDAMLGQFPADASRLDFSHDVVDLGPEIARVLGRVELSIVGEAVTESRPSSPVR